MGQIHVSRTDAVCVVTIDSPPVNALNQALIDDLVAAFAQIDTSQIRVVVVTGAGDRAFVAGADISQFPELDARSGEALARHGQEAFQQIADFPLPVICAIDGVALGGGLELALACDIRVATENSKFGLPEVALGICPGYGGTQRLPRLIGTGMAKRMMFTAAPIDAAEALRVGLCEMVVPAGEAEVEAVALAKQIAAKAAPAAVRAIKSVIDRGGEMGLDDAIRLEAKVFGALFGTADKNEGVAAFLEKRPARFSGK